MVKLLVLAAFLTCSAATLAVATSARRSRCRIGTPGSHLSYRRDSKEERRDFRGRHVGPRQRHGDRLHDDSALSRGVSIAYYSVRKRCASASSPTIVSPFSPSPTVPSISAQRWHR